LNSYWRQVTITIPVRLTAMSHSWLPWIASEIFWMSHVRPLSVERANSMKLFAPDPVKRAQQTYTFLFFHGLSTPSSASSSILSSKWPLKICDGVPRETIVVNSWSGLASGGFQLYRATQIEPFAGLPRLNAMPP
jgi:hypothetical protein